MNSSTHPTRSIPIGRQITITLLPRTDACARCEGRGECSTDELDDEGLWFKQGPCEECVGVGVAPCAADGCTRHAVRAVRIGCHEVLCCDDSACTLHAINTCLRKARPT